MVEAVSTIAQRDEQPTVWHSLEISQAIARLKTDPDTGLSDATATYLLTNVGANELTGKKGKAWWLKFLLQFNQPLLIILLCAGLVKALTGSFVNAGVIWGVTTTNAIIGFVQESKAEGAIAALAKAITTEATIIRDRQKIRIPSRELVPGDIVLLTSGDKVPADLRLIQVRNLQIDESALTGESVAIEKITQILNPDTVLAERKNMAYAGGFVTFGQGTGVVVATGNETETGRISQLMVQHTDIATPLTRKFDKFSQNWLYFVLGLATLCFAVGLSFRGFQEALEAAVALTVSAIPEGLPAVVTVTLAIGVSRMAKRNAIIRKLPAVETLGSATVICSDKTGTLTENQMTVQAIYAGGHQYTVTGVGYAPNGEILRDEKLVDLNQAKGLQECLVAGLLCNDSQIENKNGRWVVMGDPTEGALIAAANKTGLNQTIVHQKMPKLDGIPFESDYQYMVTLHATPQGNTIYVKGSVEAIIQRCSLMVNSDGQSRPLDCLETLKQTSIEREVNIMARQGLRVLALAKKQVSDRQNTVDHPDIANGLIFLGLQGMIDPPRESAIKAVQACQAAGIQVKMITGDHAVTAQAIARRMGINKNGSVLAFTGTELAKMDKTELAQVAEEGVVFARVAPEQKLRLVEALQSRGEVVAMTGDGVNDAPALKQADIGIAMGERGTDVAREAADLVLLDDDFSAIVQSVRLGRRVFDNLKKGMAYTLAVHIPIAGMSLIPVIFHWPLVLLPIHIAFLHLIIDPACTVVFEAEPEESNIMNRPPRNPRESLFSRRTLKLALLQGVGVLVVLVVVFGVAFYSGHGEFDARALAFTTLIVSNLSMILSNRSWSRTIPEMLRTPNAALWWVLGGGVVFMGLVLYVPVLRHLFRFSFLHFDDLLVSLTSGVFSILWFEGLKVWRRR